MVIKKSKDARTQLHVWSKLLDGRIALQKAVLAVRDLERVSSKDGDETRGQPADEATIKSLTKLLVCLVKLRDSYRRKSQFCAKEDEKSFNEEEYSNIDDKVLDERHTSHNDIRNGIIEKWCEKTKIGTIPKKGYAALELPTLQLISNSLKDKERLIRRTQLDRTSQIDDSFHPETFNDDDFYHQLLKEVINKDEDRKWVELQRLRYKSKRKADTKATKGRKIKKDLIQKLVNFMAPMQVIGSTNLPLARSHNQDMDRDVEFKMNDQIRAELIKSLFGGGICTQSTKTTAPRETRNVDE